jgi:hypothetical protein
MFKRGGIKTGQYVFVVQKDGRHNKVIIGRVQSVNSNKVNVVGTYIIPLGLIERVEAGRAAGRPSEALSNPDPNNCIFLLIDRVETGKFNEEVDQTTSRITWINENRYLVLDGWIKENLPDIFAAALSADTEESRAHTRQTLIEKMNSLYERDLKEHVYAVARSARIL